MIKNKLKVQLAIAEMTQKELGQLTGIRQSTINDLCTGKSKHIPIDTLDKICATLNCQPGDIFEYRETKK